MKAFHIFYILILLLYNVLLEIENKLHFTNVIQDKMIFVHTQEPGGWGLSHMWPIQECAALGGTSTILTV